jgi:methyl-galactoside transport system ATP-binding protein
MGALRLEMDNISKSFPGVKALDNVTLKVKSGSVHALMGENGAGKSTLMKCLFGIYQEDSGTITLDGKRVLTPSPKSALDMGISMIHQELNPIPYRNVMDNIWLGRYPKTSIIVDEAEMYKKTKELFAKIELTINPSALAGALSVSNLQLIEIAKAVSYNSRIIIMDEPTSSLTETEVEHLFKIIRQLRDEGRSIIYISHKMEEILNIADEVTIMRDGCGVGTWPASELTTDLIIKRMVGRDLTNRFPPKEYAPSKDEALRIENFTSADARSFRDVSFSVHKGEVLGVGGLVGAQRTELVEAIFGLRALSSGKIYKYGKEITINKPRDAKRGKLALLTEDRRQTGIIPVLSILDNTVIANQEEYASGGILKESKRYAAALNETKKLNVKMPNLMTAIQYLSGGNQQKVLVARWLLVDPDILILDEPTRGIDVGAKYEIYTIINNLAKQGKSIIMISSEMPELLGMADRVMVMCEGRLSGFLEKEEATQIEVMRLATKYMV